MLFGPKYSLRERSHLGRFFQSLHVSSEEDCFRIQLSKCCLSPVTHQPPYLPLRRRDQQDTVHAYRGLIPGAIKRYIALRWWVLVGEAPIQALGFGGESTQPLPLEHIS